MKDIRDLSSGELRDIVVSDYRGKRFRVKQILNWLYKGGCVSFEDMRNLPKGLIKYLDEHYSCKLPEVKRVLEDPEGDAVKFGFDSGGEYLFESVILRRENKRALCVSSQLGCKLNCSFCSTGSMGFIRDLTQAEILGQVVSANTYLKEQGERGVSSVIFMGMGEPLLNYEHVLGAVRVLMDRDCFGIGGRRITLSSAGVVPAIRRFIKEGLNCNLAISLNSWSDDIRDRLMPVNRTYPISELIKLAHEYHKSTGNTLTYEYVFIRGETDTDEALESLIKRFSDVPCRFNIIPLNTTESYYTNTSSRLNRFASALVERGFNVTVRKSRGRGVKGACGQLSGEKGTAGET
ncbi:MAG: 23S rRNA (adenine(2503)-C(2))-methyltransferase RlmN [Chitinivibrionales bacterium]